MRAQPIGRRIRWLGARLWSRLRCLWGSHYPSREDCRVCGPRRYDAGPSYSSRTLRRWGYALLGAALLGCARPPAAPDAPAVTFEALPPPAPPPAPPAPDLTSGYLQATTWVGGRATRNGMGVVVHDCAVHGLLVATCEHVVDDLAYVWVSLWPYGTSDVREAVVVAEDVDDDVAILLVDVPEDRIRRWTPELAPPDPPGVILVAAVQRDGGASWLDRITRQPESDWYVCLNGAIRYGDSGSPVFDGAHLAGVIRRMDARDRRVFGAAPAAEIRALLASVAGEDAK